MTDGANSAKGGRGSTIIAIVGLITTAAAAIISNIVTTQAAQDAAWTVRNAQIVDQRRTAYVDFLGEVTSLCALMTHRDLTLNAANDAYGQVLTQKARVDLIAPTEVRERVEEFRAYMLIALTTASKADPNLPEGCDDKGLATNTENLVNAAKPGLEG
ncbi:hypothetical protein F4553_000473 [Allocatelliglobosispora scoriae]|uniref:Uncharacterized protein n=1 Tax=Allocatelliglobosispora scoriae TaxID=643052 RepID=A0A841BFM6_9ACTN|nr:hypothetical protein [Allocatelliglobosispora scoriae]MBB5867094.1 hypothetical protein [Allocatelliglobosispora scoriae]